MKALPDVKSGNITRERIVVPKPLAPALLYHMHNHWDNHPSKSQQKILFQRNFYTLSLEKQLDLLYKNCYKCSIIQKLPKVTIANDSKTPANIPHTYFHADIIRRAKQYILIIKDHFTSFHDAMLLNSEKAEDLKLGLTMLTSAIRKPGKINITVDNSPGFTALMSRKDKDLQNLMITLVKTDEINKNSNAVIDKGCLELE